MPENRITLRYYDYHKELKFAESCLFSLTGENTLYWKTFEGHTVVNHFAEGCVQPFSIGKDARRKYFLFPARADVSLIKESKVVGYYDKIEFPADLDGPLVGFGQAWYDEDDV